LLRLDDFIVIAKLGATLSGASDFEGLPSGDCGLTFGSGLRLPSESLTSESDSDDM